MKFKFKIRQYQTDTVLHMVKMFAGVLSINSQNFVVYEQQGNECAEYGGNLSNKLLSVRNYLHQ